MASDREVAGIRCTEVLAVLSDYVDGEVEAELQGRIEGHLRGCDWCERFGGRFSGIVVDLRKQLRQAEPLPPELVGRLLKLQPSD